jgi:hypothetical protein
MRLHRDAPFQYLLGKRHGVGHGESETDVGRRRVEHLEVLGTGEDGGVLHLVHIFSAQAEIETLRSTCDAGEWVLASRNRGKRLANLRPSNQRLLGLTGIEPRVTQTTSGAPRPPSCRSLAWTPRHRPDTGPPRQQQRAHHLPAPRIRRRDARALALLRDRIEVVVTGRAETSSVVRSA